MKAFDINFLDHVAIRVKNMEASIQWYQEVLGLNMYKLKEWGEFPVFMLAGKSGIAIFPADLADDMINQRSRYVIIDHFAFNVSNKDFLRAQDYFNKINQDFDFQDHHYFHSIYLRDPDNHKVELTTIMVNEDAFYKY